MPSFCSIFSLRTCVFRIPGRPADPTDRIQNKRVKASNNKQQQQPDGSAQGN
jgi:hypothetical protein